MHKPHIFICLTLIYMLLIAQFWVTAQDPATPTNNPLLATMTTPTFTPSPPAPNVTITPPTPIPTAIIVSAPLALPALQPITRENATLVEFLFTLKCQLVGEPGSRTGILATTFSPVENRLAAVAYGAVCVFDLAAPDSRPVIIKTFSGMTAVFTPDGQSLFTLHNGDDLYKWNPKTGEELPTRLQAASIFASPQVLAFSPDGRMMANGGRHGFRLSDVATEQLILRLPVGLTTVVIWKPDGSGLITNENGKLGLYTLYPDLRLFRDATLPSTGKSGMAIGGRNNEFAAYVSPQGVRVINMDSLEVVASPERIGEQILAFSPADPLLLMGAAHGGFGFWDVEHDQLISSSLGNDYSVPDSAAFNADGTLLAMGLDNGVSLWGVPQ